MVCRYSTEQRIALTVLLQYTAHISHILFDKVQGPRFKIRSQPAFKDTIIIYGVIFWYFGFNYLKNHLDIQEEFFDFHQKCHLH